MSLYNSFFSHQLLRKYIVAFGQLFNGLEVVRFKTDGTEDSRVQVPIAYGPKEKWLVRLTQDPSPTPDKPPAIVLPRIGYDIAGMNYAPDRKQLNNVRIQVPDPIDANNHHRVFQPVPYDIQFNLFIIAKSPDDGAQIVEQIFPIFTPDYSVAVKTIPEINKIDDINISLVATVPEDTYSGAFTERRYVTWNLQFNMKAWFYGPVNPSGIIKNVNVNLFEIASDISGLTAPEITLPDSTPTPVPSQTLSDVQLNTVIEFTPFTVGGMTTGQTAPISISNGQYSLDEGITWTSAAGTVAQGQSVTVRQTTPVTTSTATVTLVTVGPTTGTFTSVTSSFSSTYSVYQTGVYETGVYV